VFLTVTNKVQFERLEWVIEKAVRKAERAWFWGQTLSRSNVHRQNAVRLST
jgi:hypothetical protein